MRKDYKIPTTSYTSMYSNYSRGRRKRGRIRRGIFESRWEGRTSDKIDKQCYYCNKFGHFENECRLKALHEAKSGGDNYGEEESSSHLSMSMVNNE